MVPLWQGPACHEKILWLCDDCQTHAGECHLNQGIIRVGFWLTIRVLFFIIHVYLCIETLFCNTNFRKLYEYLILVYSCTGSTACACRNSATPSVHHGRRPFFPSRFLPLRLLQPLPTSTTPTKSLPLKRQQKMGKKWPISCMMMITLILARILSHPMLIQTCSPLPPCSSYIPYSKMTLRMPKTNPEAVRNWMTPWLVIISQIMMAIIWFPMPILTLVLILFRWLQCIKPSRSKRLSPLQVQSRKLGENWQIPCWSKIPG